MAGRKTKSLTFEPFLVIKDCRKFAPCLLFAEPAHEPFAQIVMRFAAIAGLASGNDVRRYSTGTIGIVERDEMISGQAHIDKQSRRIAAVGTTTMPVFKRGIPIADAKCIRQSLLACIAAIIRGASMFPMGDVPTSVNPFALFGIGTAVLSGAFSKLFGIGVISAAAVFCDFSFIPLIGCMTLRDKLIAQTIITLATALQALCAVRVIVQSVFRLMTGVAERPNAALARPVFCKRGEWLPDLTNGANFPDGKRFVNHEVFPYWPYIRKCGKAVRLAVQTVNYAVLSHLSIIPYAGGIC